MGYGTYSHSSYKSSTKSRGIDDATSRYDTFKQRLDISNSARSLNSNARHFNKVEKHAINVGVRECRDSEEHPNTTPIVIAFDVTGSMGNIPYVMIKDQFPKLMRQLIEAGVSSPQICFMAVGDHEFDEAPIQVNQFENDAEKLVAGLQSLFLEEGGGGNSGESYLLAWIMAGNHTELDSYYLRGKKGFLFTIGDEPNLPEVPASALEEFLGYEKGCKAIKSGEALELAKQQYHVYHIHCTDSRRYDEIVQSTLGEALGDNLITGRSSDLHTIISDIILKHQNEDTESCTELGADPPSKEENTNNTIGLAYL